MTCGPNIKSHRQRGTVILPMLALMLAGVACFTLGTGRPTAFAENLRSLKVAANPLFVSELTQGSDLDYSNFKHNSARHASLSCNSCHQRTSDNSITPKFPSHPACISCHSSQFFTPGVPMCSICHVDVKSSPPPLKPSRQIQRKF